MMAEFEQASLLRAQTAAARESLHQAF